MNAPSLTPAPLSLRERIEVRVRYYKGNADKIFSTAGAIKLKKGAG
jgi:hypothetical protein